LGLIDALVQNKYVVDLVTTIIAVILTSALGGRGGTTTRNGLVTVVVMNFNISLLFIQYSGDIERIKFVWVIVWVFFIIAIVTAYALGRGGLEVSMGAAPGLVRRIGSPLFSGILVFILYVAVDLYFDPIRQFLSTL
jgi:hypothetical protein